MFKLPDSDYSESTSSESYDDKSSEDEFVNSIVNRNLDPPFIEKQEIQMSHDNSGNVQYRKHQLTMGGTPVSEVASEPNLYENDPFKRDELYAYSERGLGPQSFLSTWEPKIGYELYANWMEMMRAMKMQGRLEIAKQFLIIFGGVTIGLFFIYWAVKRFRLLGPFMRMVPKRFITRNPAELHSKVTSQQYL